MPDISVEEAVKQNCQALIGGDLMRVMNDLTPEAMSQLMSGGGNMGAMPSLTAFDIQDHTIDGDDHVFKIHFAGDQEINALATWRDVGGQWKIAALALAE